MNPYWLANGKPGTLGRLIAERDAEQLVYVVTDSPPVEFAWVHDRWPRLVNLRAAGNTNH